MGDLVNVIGKVSFSLAQEIISLAETTKRNKEICKEISNRVKESIADIATHLSRGDLQGNIQKSADSYEEVLDETLKYVKEITEKKEGSRGKYIKKIMDFFRARRVSEMHKKVIERLDYATNRFYNNVAHDSNNKITDTNRKISETNEKLVEMILLLKGAFLTDDEIEELKIDPSALENCEVEIARDNIRKRKYNGDEVAVKNMGKILLEDIANELKIIDLLSKHEPIEKFFGVYYEDDVNRDRCLFVVTEWMEYGNLRKYLDDHENGSLSWPIKFQIAEQIAKGLSYCIDNKLFHRDVRSKNVLINERFQAKLTNFTMSRKFQDPTREMSYEIFRWTAPEKLQRPDKKYTEKCEVFSFGVFLWEISTHGYPFNNIVNDMDVKDEIIKGKLPGPFSEDTPAEYKKLVEEALSYDPEMRPSMRALRRKLERLRINSHQVTRSC